MICNHVDTNKCVNDMDNVSNVNNIPNDSINMDEIKDEIGEINNDSIYGESAVEDEDDNNFTNKQHTYDKFHGKSVTTINHCSHYFNVRKIDVISRPTVEGGTYHSTVEQHDIYQHPSHYSDDEILEFLETNCESKTKKFRCGPNMYTYYFTFLIDLFLPTDNKKISDMGSAEYAKNYVSRNIIKQSGQTVSSTKHFDCNFIYRATYDGAYVSSLEPIAPLRIPPATINGKKLKQMSTSISYKSSDGKLLKIMIGSINHKNTNTSTNNYSRHRDRLTLNNNYELNLHGIKKITHIGITGDHIATKLLTNKKRRYMRGDTALHIIDDEVSQSYVTQFKLRYKNIETNKWIYINMFKGNDDAFSENVISLKDYFNVAGGLVTNCLQLTPTQSVGFAICRVAVYGESEDNVKEEVLKLSCSIDIPYCLSSRNDDSKKKAASHYIRTYCPSYSDWDYKNGNTKKKAKIRKNINDQLHEYYCDDV